MAELADVIASQSLSDRGGYSDEVIFDTFLDTGEGDRDQVFLDDLPPWAAKWRGRRRRPADVGESRPREVRSNAARDARQRATAGLDDAP